MNIAEQMVAKFLARSVVRGNYELSVSRLKIFGNVIAEWREDELWITDAGWKTQTTELALRIFEPTLSQDLDTELVEHDDDDSSRRRRSGWLIRGEPWDGSWRQAEHAEQQWSGAA